MYTLISDSEDVLSLEKRNVKKKGRRGRRNRKRVLNYEVLQPPFAMSGPRSIVGRGVVLHENPDDLGQAGVNGQYPVLR